MDQRAQHGGFDLAPPELAELSLSLAYRTFRQKGALFLAARLSDHADQGQEPLVLSPPSLF